MRAFIHTVGGVAFNEECASAWRGFERLGIEVVPFSDNETLDLASRDDVVVAGMLVCSHVLSRHGVEMPSIDYPREVSKFLGRRVRKVAASSLSPADLPLFMKPVAEKDLPGTVVTDAERLLPYLEKGGDYQLYVSDPVNFVSEWRVFVRNRRVLGATHYRGDRSVEPEWLVARDVIFDWYHGRPDAYALDLGVTDDGRTLVVEVNDGFALGSYGLDDVSYALFLSARWSQLMGVPDGLHYVEAPKPSGAIGEAARSQRWNDRLYHVAGARVPRDEPDLPAWLWGVAANVRDFPAVMTEEQAEGRRKGTKHFAAGSLVWVVDAGWYADGRVAVVGKKKGSHRYIRKVMRADQLENYRAKRVYSPTVISWMCGAREEIRNHGDSGRYSQDGSWLLGTFWDRADAKDFAAFANGKDKGVGDC